MLTCKAMHSSAPDATVDADGCWAGPAAELLGKGLGDAQWGWIRAGFPKKAVVERAVGQGSSGSWAGESPRRVVGHRVAPCRRCTLNFIITLCRVDLLQEGVDHGEKYLFYAPQDGGGLRGTGGRGPISRGCSCARLVWDDGGRGCPPPLHQRGLPAQAVTPSPQDTPAQALAASPQPQDASPPSPARHRGPAEPLHPPPQGRLRRQDQASPSLERGEWKGSSGGEAGKPDRGLFFPLALKKAPERERGWSWKYDFSPPSCGGRGGEPAPGDHAAKPHSHHCSPRGAAERSNAAGGGGRSGTEPTAARVRVGEAGPGWPAWEQKEESPSVGCGGLRQPQAEGPSTPRSHQGDGEGETRSCPSSLPSPARN